MYKFESEEKKKIRDLLKMEDVDDYELENPREITDFSYFGDQESYLENKRLNPIKIFIYGNYPHFEKATAYFMLRKANVEFSNQYKPGYYDIGWFWDSRITLDKRSKKCREQSEKLKFINLFLIDTSKDFVAKSMEKYFGYTFKIDPKTYNGYCIAKHNGNGTKSCFFLKCPIDADEIFHDHCYQKIINYVSENDTNILYEIRIPIFKNIIPFSFFKTRNKGLRFTSKNKSMNIVPATYRLSIDECQQILSYCHTIGLEYGELDILRCSETGKIYIIDVNNTPWWPPNKLGDVERNISLNMMWNAFLEAFIPEKFNDYHIPDMYLDDFVSYKNPERNNREKKQISYNGFKFVGARQELQYTELWKELHIKFLTQPPPTPKLPPQKPKTPSQKNVIQIQPSGKNQQRSQTPKKQSEQKSCPLKNKKQENKSEIKAADYQITLLKKK